jgi:ketosteroid isomerase-like protein
VALEAVEPHAGDPVPVAKAALVKAALLTRRHTDGFVSEEPVISDGTPADPVEALTEGCRYCLATDDQQGDLAAGILELFDPSVRLDFSERIFNPTVHEGHAGVLQWRTELAEIWESFRADPQDLFRGEDVFVVFVAEVSRGRLGGTEATRETALMCRIRGNRIAELRSFVDRTRALREAGLEPAAKTPA